MAEGIKLQTASSSKYGAVIDFVASDVAAYKAVAGGGYTVTTTDGTRVMLVDTTSGAQVITQNSTGNLGRRFIFIHQTASNASNSISASPALAKGSWPYSMYAVYETLECQAITADSSSSYQVTEPSTRYTTISGTWTFNGGSASSSVTVRLMKRGNWVYMFIPAVTVNTSTASNTFTFSGNIPAYFRDTVPIEFRVPGIKDNTQMATAGYLVVDGSGNLILYKDATTTTNWGNTVSGGFNTPVVVSYSSGTVG